MKSAEYWKRAALLREVAVQEGATATAKDVLKLYDDALDDINTEVQKIKYNFQQRFGLDDKTAAMFLTEAQREENLASLIYALENAPDEKSRQAILKYIQRDGLSVRAYASRIERYDAVKQSIYARLKRLAADEMAAVAAMAKKAYSMSYYSVMDDTAKGLDVGINFGILNDRAIDEAVSAKWSGKRFSERIWQNTDKLADEAQKLVTKSIMSGESWNKTADKLANRFQVEKYHATTLVHTEAAHAHNMADMKAYEDLGIEEYKWLSTLDYATCSMCQPLDGQVFKVSEAKEGATIPPLHPRCRCTSTINMDYTSRRARNPLTGKNEIVDGNLTYEQWVKTLSPEQQQALNQASNRKSQRVSDKLDKKLAETQYKRDITKDVDNSAKNGKIGISIDEFVPCLKEKATGKIVSTEVSSLSRAELVSFTKQTGWNDEWSKRPKNEEIFGVFVKGEAKPQGLISLRYDKGATYIASASTAPHNNRQLVGDNQQYIGVGGHLFAVAVEQSIKNDGNGAIYGYAVNKDVLNHYITEFGAEHLPIAHEYQFIIEGEASQRLMDIYNYERRK